MISKLLTVFVAVFGAFQMIRPVQSAPASPEASGDSGQATVDYTTGIPETFYEPCPQEGDVRVGKCGGKQGQ